MKMTEQEDREYDILADKRETDKLTAKEHKRWIVLVEKSFAQGIPTIVKSWMNGFVDK